MDNYGKGKVLGDVSVLPATAAGGLLFFDMASPVIIIGLIAISIISMMITTGYMRRYLKNKS